MASVLFRVGDPRRHGHQALYLNPPQSRYGPRQTQSLLGRDPMLGRFAPDINFQKDLHLGVPGLGSTLNLLGQSQRVYRVYKVEQVEAILNLIALQVADKMPRDALAANQRDLGPRLLNPVFSKVGKPAGDGLSDDLSRKGLCYSHQSHIFRLPAGTAGGLGDTLLNPGNPFGQKRPIQGGGGWL